MRLISFNQFTSSEIDVKSIKGSGFDLIIETADGSSLKIEDGLPELVTAKGTLKLANGTTVDYKSLLETIIQESPDLGNLDIGFVGEERKNESSEDSGTGIKEGVLDSLKASLKKLLSEQNGMELTDSDMEEMTAEEMEQALAKALENAQKLADLEAQIEQEEQEELEERLEEELLEEMIAEEEGESEELSESAEKANNHVEDMKNELAVEEVEVNENTSDSDSDAEFDAQPNKNTGSSNKSGDYDQEGEPVEEETYEFTVSLSSETDSGSKGDFITNVGEPIFQGTGIPSSIVTLTINGADYSTTVDSEGNWLLPPVPELEEGEYPYTVSDSAGNSASGVVIIDQTNTLTHDLQNDTGSSDSDEITQDSRLVYVGKTDPGSEVVIKIDGKEYSTTANADGDYTLTTTDDLPDGTYDYEIITEDVAGNIVTNTGTVVVDTQIDATISLLSSQDTGSSDSDGLTKENTNLTLVGNVETGATATLMFNGGNYPVQVQPDGSWSVTIDGTLPDGVYSYTLTVSDLAGNVEEIIGNIEVDTETHVAGGLDDISDTGVDSDDGLTKDNQPVFSGEGEPNSTVTVAINGRDYSTTVSSNGEWQLMVEDTLPDGTHSYTITIVDTAGNDEAITGTIEIDTTTLVEAELGTDSGRDADDNITNIKNNVIEGQAEAGSTGTITITGINGDAPMPLDIQPDGSFSFETSELADGTYQFTIATTDQAGNEAEFTDSFTVDTVTQVSGGLDEGSDSGSKNDDGITNDSTPTFSGRGEPNSEITLMINDASYTTFVDEDGVWSVDVTDALPDGVMAYEIKAVDVAGNEATTTGNITVDTQKPTGATIALDNDTGESASDWVTKNAQLKLSGSAEAGAGVSVTVAGVTYTEDNGLVLASDGSWTLELAESLDEGDYEIVVEVTDAAGNVEELTQNVKVDTDTFIVGGLDSRSDSGDRSDDNITNVKSPIFSGQAEPNSSVTVTINNESYNTTSDDQGNWSVTDIEDLPDGNYNVVMTVVDAAGNEAVTSTDITVDTVAPIASTLELKNDSGESGKDFITQNNIPVFSGETDPNSDVQIRIELENGESYDYKEPDVVVDKTTGEWTFTSPIQLPDGAHTVEVISIDLAGNESVREQELVVDTSIELTAQLDSSSDSGDKGDKLTNIQTPTFNGTGAEGDTVTLNINGNSYNATVAPDGTWSIRVSEPLPHNPNTPYDYEVVVVDKAGNTTSKSDSITIDTETNVSGGLDVSSDSALLDGITSDATPTFTGQAEIGSEVTLTLDDKTYTASVDSNGRWNVDVPTSLSDGTYAYEIRAVDEAGNVNVLSDTITIDTVNSVSGGLDPNSDSDATDGITNQNTPKFIGTGEAGATITVSIGGKEYTGVVDSQGEWEVLISEPLSDGVHSYQITSVDIAGNEASIPAEQVTIDTQTFVTGGLAPGQDTGRDFNDQLTNIDSPLFAGTGEDGAVVTLTIDGNSYAARVSNGTWIISDINKLSDGVHTYVIHSADIAGNTNSIQGQIEVDTTPPEFTAAKLTNDTGESDSDMITRDGNVGFTGSVDSEDVLIEVSLDGNIYSSPEEVSINPDGTWSFTLPYALPENQSGHNFTITYTDMAGNSVDQAGVIVVDQSNFITGGLDAASDSGKAGDDLTNETRPVFSGATEPNAKVTLEINGQSYEVTANVEGLWQITVDDNLPDGEHPYTLTSVDIAGNESESSGAIEVDTTPSSLGSIQLSNDTGTDGEDWITREDTPTWTGVIEEEAELTITVQGSGITHVLRSPDDFTVNSDGSFSATLPASLNDGSYTVTFDAVDAAGNTSFLQETLVIDTVVSVDGGLSDSSDSGFDNQDNVTSDDTPSFNGTGEVDGTINITINGVAYSTVVDSNGEWSFTMPTPLEDGVYPVAIEIVDVAGNVSNATPFDLTIDTTDPVVDFVRMTSDTGNDTSDGLTRENRPTFEGRVEVGCSVELRIDSVTYPVPPGSIDANGDWSFTLPSSLDDGRYTWEVVVVDAAGNQTTETGDIEIDTVNTITGGLSADSDTGDDNSDNITSNTTPLFNGTTEANANVILTLSNGDLYPVNADDQGNWEIEVTRPLPEGVHTYDVISVDAAGNEATIRGSITVDTTAPTGSIVLVSDTGDSSTDGITRSRTPVFSGTSEPGSQVEVIIDGMTYGEPAVKVELDGTWSFVTPLELSDGAYTVEVRIEDTAGNVFEDQIDITIDNAIFMTGGLLSFSDSGVDNSDGITSDNTPSFGGTAEDGASVTLTIGGNTYTDVASDEQWQINVTPALADGDYTYTLLVEDAAGNSDEINGRVTVDTSTTVSGGLDFSSDTGRDNSDQVTSNNQPTFSGTAESEATVTVTIGAQSMTVTANSSGEWTLQWPSIIPDGRHTVEIYSVDLAGNDATVTENITIDTTDPLATTVTLVNDTGISGDSMTNSDRPQFSGQIGAGEELTFRIDGRTYTAPNDITLNPDGTWSFEVPVSLSDDTYNYEVRVEDIAGNETTTTGTVVVDTSFSMTVSLDADSDSGTEGDDITSDTTPTFRGAADAGATITLFINGVTYTEVADANGEWSITATTSLPDGDYPYTINGEDAAGNRDTYEGTVTIDTTTSIDGGLDSSTDSGLTGDSITNSENLTFSGTAEEGATVEIDIDGGIYPATVDRSGNWAVTLPNIIPEGVHSYTVRTTDVAGNTDEFTQSVEVDRTNFITADMSAASDSGSDQTDNITNVNNPTFEGSTQAGSTVTLTVNGSITYSIPTNSDGSWTFTFPSELSDGSYQYEFRSEDAAGNVSVESGQFVVDTVAIHDGGLSTSSDSGVSGDDITSDTTPTFDGTGEEGASIEIEINDKRYDTTVDAQGQWSITIPEGDALPDGTYAYTITTVDVAGNQAVIPKTITIDTLISVTATMDSDTGNSAIDGITQSTTPSFSGTMEVGATLTVEINDIVYGEPDVVVNQDGTWSFTVPDSDALVDGSYDWVVRVEDAAGNVDTDNGTVVVDNTAPTDLAVELLNGSVSDRSITNEPIPRFGGTSEVGTLLEITMNGVAVSSSSITVNADGTWEFTVPNSLDDGDYTFEFISTDDAGNSQTVIHELEVDTVTELSGGLDVSSDSGLTGDDITNSTDIKYSGEGEAGSTVEVKINEQTYTTIVEADGTWEVDLTEPLPEGTYAVEITLTDAAGNVEENTQSLNIDRTNTITATLQTSSDTGSNTNDGVTSDSQPVFVGRTEASSTVSLSIQGGMNYSVPVNADGSFEFQIPSALTDGTYSYTFTSIDTAGNSMASNGTFTVDTVTTIDGGLDVSSDTGVTGDNITSETNPTFSGSGEENCDVIFEINNVQYNLRTDEFGNWSFTIPAGNELPNGTHAYSVTITDLAGNTHPIVGSIEVDTSTFVTARLDSDSGRHSNDGITSDSTPTFSGTMEQGADIRLSINSQVYDTSTGITVNADGSWEFTLPSSDALPDGSYNWVVTVEDDAGNVDTNRGVIQVDTTDPTELTVALQNGSVTDTSITSESKPQFGGESEAGTQIEIRVNGSPQPSSSVAVNPDGTWTFEAPAELSDGNYSFEFISTDVAGNSQTIVHDLRVDTATTVTGGLDPTCDTGLDGNDGVTNSRNIIFSGTGESGAEIRLVIDGQNFTATVNDAGTWSIPVGALDGSNNNVYNYTILATDLAGNTDTTSGNITVDTVAPVEPTVLLDSSSDSEIQGDWITNSDTIVLSGTSEVGTQLTVRVGGTTQSVTPDQTGAWTLDLAEYPEGTHLVEIVSTDNAGNTAVATETLVVDRTIALSGGLVSSSDSGSSSEDGITNETKPTFSGKTDANASVTLTITLDNNGGQVVLNTVADAHGDWTIDNTDYAVDLPDGDHIYQVTAVDAAGNTDTFSDRITIDTLITLSLKLDDSTNSVSKSDDITNDSTPRFSGSGQALDLVDVTIFDNNGIEVQSLGATVGASGSWFVDVQTPLPDGDYTITAIVTDLAGNTTSQTTTVTIDTTPPAVLTGGLDDSTNTGDKGDTVTKSTMPKFSGTVEQDCTVQLDFGSGQVYDAVVYDDGRWDYQTGVAFVDGTYDYKIIATDVAGNSTSQDHQITIDNTISFSGDLADNSDTGWSQDDYHTSESRPIYEGNTDPFSEVEVTLNGNPPRSISTEADANGVFSINLGDLYGSGGSLPDGEHNLTIVATDPAGNVTSRGQQIVVDTTKPTNVTVGLDTTTDSGNKGDWITNDSTPVLTGTSEYGDVKLIVRIDGQNNEVTINSDGTWSFAVPQLADGTYEVQVTSEDKAGNKTVVTESLTIDTTIPTGITGGLAAFDDRGEESNDGITNKKENLTFEGLAEVDATVEIKISGVVYPCAVDANGQWSVLVPTTFSDGTYTVEISVTDVAGNTGKESFDFTVDTSAPTITKVELSDNDDTGVKGDNITNKANPVVDGTVTTDAARVWITIDSTTKSFDATLNPDGSWNCEFTGLGEGTHVYTVHAVDIAGNVTSSQGNVVTIDTTNNVEGGLIADSDSGREQNDGITNNTTPTFEGTTDLGNAVLLEIKNDQSQTVYRDQQFSNDGTFSFTVGDPLPDGDYSYEIIAIDDAGNAVTEFGNITIDTTSSVSLRLDPSSDTGTTGDDLTNHKNPKISGTAEPTSNISIGITGVFSGSAQTKHHSTVADSNGNWIFAIPDELVDGDYTISVTAVDVAGNTSVMETITITVDRTPPTVTGQIKTDTGSSTSDGVTRGVESGSNQGHLDFSGTSSGGAEKIVISIGGKSYEAIPSADGAWEFVIPTKLADGTYAYNITSVDAAGNVSEPVAGSVTLDTRIDGEATLHSDSDSGVAGDNLTNDSSPVISGSGEAGLSMTAKLSGGGLADVNLGNVVADGNGDWQLDLGTLLGSSLTDGVYDIVFTATDVAGNTGTFTYRFEVDTTPPALTLNAYNGSEITEGKPELAGTGEAGATVYLIMEGKKYQVAVASDGTWSFPTTSLPSLPDGKVEYYIYSIDIAGNRTNNTNDSFMVNTGTYVEGGLDADYDTGELDSDGYTQSRSPQFSGTGEAGGAIDVNIYDENGQLIGTYSTTVGLDGLWSVVVPQSGALNDGTYTYTVTIDDQAGNVVTTEPSDLIVDNSVAISSISAWSANYGGKLIGDTWYVTDRGGLYITGMLAGKEAGAAVKVTVSGEEFIGVSDKNGKFLIPINLPDGTHVAEVTITDRAGNSTSATVKFNIDDTVDFTFACNDDVAGEELSWIVNNSRPTFSGECDTDSARSVYIELFGLHASTIHGDIQNGKWVIEPNQDLPDGTYSFRIVYREESGRWIEHRGQMIIDTTNEVMSLQTLDQNLDAQGEWASTKITGFAEPNATVTVTLDGVEHTTTVPSSGVWTIDVPIVSNGDYAFNVESVDVAGNVCVYSNDPNNSLKVDFIDVLNVDAKEGEVLSPSNGLFTGKGDVGNSIMITFVDVNTGQTYVRYAAVDAKGGWKVDLSELPDGDYTYEVTASSDWDEKTEVGTIVLDSTPPVIEQLTLDDDTGDVGDKTTRDTEPTLSGKVSSDAERIEITFGSVKYVSGTDFVMNSDGTFSFTVPASLSDGQYTYSIDVYDVAGNKATQSDHVIIDTQGSAFNDLNVQGEAVTQEGVVVKDQTPELSGKVDTDVTELTVEVNGVTLQSKSDFFILPDGTWSVTLTTPLPDGIHQVNLTATDAAGNVTSDSFDLEVDTQAPVGAGGLDPLENDILDPDTNTIRTSQPVFTGTGEVGATVVVKIGEDDSKAIVDQNGNWRVEFSQPLSDGKHLYVIEIIDTAGNSTQIDFDLLSIDTTPPPVSIDAASTGEETAEVFTEVNGNQVKFSGVAEFGDVVTVDLAGEQKDASVNFEGNWKSSFEVASADKELDYSITKISDAGNESVLEVGRVSVDSQIVGSREDVATSDGDTVHVFGSSDPNTEIKLSIDGVEHSAVSDESGNWEYSVSASADSIQVVKVDGGNEVTDSVEVVREPGGEAQSTSVKASTSHVVGSDDVHTQNFDDSIY